MQWLSQVLFSFRSWSWFLYPFFFRLEIRYMFHWYSYPWPNSLWCVIHSKELPSNCMNLMIWWLGNLPSRRDLTRGEEPLTQLHNQFVWHHHWRLWRSTAFTNGRTPELRAWTGTCITRPDRFIDEPIKYWHSYYIGPHVGTRSRGDEPRRQQGFGFNRGARYFLGYCLRRLLISTCVIRPQRRAICMFLA
jgi:hypothetical protein